MEDEEIEKESKLIVERAQKGSSKQQYPPNSRILFFKKKISCYGEKESLKLPLSGKLKVF